ncbi:MAG: fatty acyl-AMP ligase [Candidatus Hydrogenedentes bacterium]|nr:fatty acyl-AMP ligase [Candidatus Hydrogenedentota bacterium]
MQGDVVQRGPAAEPSSTGGDFPAKTTLAETLEAATLVELLRKRSILEPDRVLFHFLGDDLEIASQVTVAELDRQARAIAVELRRRGAAGQRALLVYPPGLEYVAAFYGCLYAGVVAVPAYPPNPARLAQTLPRLRVIVTDSQPVVALTTATVLPLLERLGELDTAFVPVQWLASDAVTPEQASEWTDPGVNASDLAFLQYTSGSTASPKGVMVTHANLLYNAAAMAHCVQYRVGEVIVSWLPTFHDMGLVCGLLLPLYKGLSIYLMSPLTFLQRPVRWLQAISRYRGTQSAAPNFAYDLCVRKTTPEQRAALDLSQWRVTANAAEPVRKDTLDRFSETFANCGIRGDAFLVGYGLAEATLKVTSAYPGQGTRYCVVRGADLEQHRVVEVSETEPDARTITGCGRPQLDTQVRIVHPETRRMCAPDEVGEIWVSGPTVARGYWNNDEATKQTFRATIADTGEGPFLRTGDLGFVKDNELYVTGRLKDLIIVDGLNHYPQDIEWTAQGSHPAIRPGCCAAFSVEKEGQERVVVAVEVAPGYEPVGTGNGKTPLDAEEVVKAIRRAVSEAHGLRVSDVALLNPGTIAKTSSGKIQRHASRQGYVAGTLDLWGK